MRYVTPLVVLAALVFAPASASADEGPATLKELGDALGDLGTRLAALVEEANKDPAMRVIEKYADMTPEQLKLKRRSPRASDLAEIMVNPEKNFNVRMKAKEVLLHSARFRGDPDFSLSEKQGGMSKRAYWCTKNLVPHLRHDDVKSRKLTNELLGGAEKPPGMWRARTISHIRDYDPNNKRTWKPAQNAWKKYLKKE